MKKSLEITAEEITDAYFKSNIQSWSDISIEAK